MTGEFYFTALNSSIIIIAALVLLRIIARITAGKRLIEHCRQLISNGSRATGRLINKKITSSPGKKDKDDPYCWLLTYEYTVNGTVYTTKKRYTSRKRNRDFPEDPNIYFDPGNPEKGYVEAEPDVYTGGDAVLTAIRTALLLGLYWVAVFFVLTQTFD